MVEVLFPTQVSDVDSASLHLKIAAILMFMSLPVWFLVVGAVLLAMVLTNAALSRLFISNAMLYLVIGYLAGASGLVSLTPQSRALEFCAETALLIALFSVGLKMGRVPVATMRWILPVRLAVLTMLSTAGLVAFAAWKLLGLSPGYAVLLGGILAPTDPVLASGVQTEGGVAPERLRFALAGEGGLNDGTAYPVVMLGLGMLGIHEMGYSGSRWWLVDVAWASMGGLGIGAVVGGAIERAVVYIRVRRPRAEGLDEFVSLGVIATAYGAAQICLASGFLAVFAAGLALQRIRLRSQIGVASTPAVSAANAALTNAVSTFNGQLEKLAELAMVLIVGVLLASVPPSTLSWIFAVLLLVVVRPAAVLVGIAGLRMRRDRRAMLAWFGIRGIGSIYYLLHAINHGVPASTEEVLVGATLAAVGMSIMLHGISAIPLLRWYGRPIN
jgi:NhaP-type Na+/H+ or K+/H+ antiporter